MGKRTKVTECVYCGKRKRTTRDHVVSKNLFPDSYPKRNIITVPSCRRCNKGFSLDEEYFRIFVCGAALEHSDEANELFFSKIRRGVQRRWHIVSDLYERMDLVDQYTESGLYLGRKARLDISDRDWARHCNVLGKYIRGLYFHEFARILPVNYKIVHLLSDLKMLEELKLDYINVWNLDHREIFAYGYAQFPDTYNSIWLTVFYDCVLFLSFTGTEEQSALFAKSKT